MLIHGIELSELLTIVEMIDLLDVSCYQRLMPTMPKTDDVIHYSDIRIMHLDEGGIHLRNCVGWKKGSDIDDEYDTCDRIFECKVPILHLLNEAITMNERVDLVEWVETEVEQTEKRDVISADRLTRQSTIKTTWKGKNGGSLEIPDDDV